MTIPGALFRLMPFRTSSVFRSPPVVIEAPGSSALNESRSTGWVLETTSGPDRLAEWKPLIAEITPLLTVIWPMLRMCVSFAWP